jgi:hypothetical protein
MVGYIDSSAVLDFILEGSTGLDQTWSLEKTFSSDLLAIECRRAILREKMQGTLDDGGILDAFDRFSQVLARTELIALTKPIQQRASEAFPLHTKTLDALHLASALAVKVELEEEVVVFSLDQDMNRCAKVLGLSAPWLA